jgi:hypothetical protein
MADSNDRGAGVRGFPRKTEARKRALRLAGGTATVASLDDFRHRETVAVCRYIGDKARRGEIQGMLMMCRGSDGVQHHAFTGVFKNDLEAMLLALTQATWKVQRSLADAQEKAWSEE